MKIIITKWRKKEKNLWQKLNKQLISKWKWDESIYTLPQ